MKFQSWTISQLFNFSSSMANVLGSELHLVKSSNNSDGWTTEKLVNMSRSLARAYYPGL